MKVDHQGYRRTKLRIEHYLRLTVVGGGFFKGFVLGVVKTVGTWELLACAKSCSASGCQLGPGTAYKVDAIGY